MRSKFSSAAPEKTLQRLRAAGCPIQAAHTQECQPDLRIVVVRPEATVAYDRRVGTEIIFAIQITNCSYARVIIQGFRGRLGGLYRLLWFGDPRTYTPVAQTYRFESGLTLPYDEVINHRVGKKGIIEPGAHIKGSLIAYTMFDRLDYLHGEMAPAAIFVLDQHGRKHRADFDVRVDRTATLRPFVLTPGREPLFKREKPRQDQCLGEETDRDRRSRTKSI